MDDHRPKIEYNPEHFYTRRRLEPWETLERDIHWFERPIYKWCAWGLVVVGILSLLFLGDGVM